jgi:hypothetical protein
LACGKVPVLFCGRFLSFLLRIYRWHASLLLRHMKVHMFQKAFLPKKNILISKKSLHSNGVQHTLSFLKRVTYVLTGLLSRFISL